MAFCGFPGLDVLKDLLSTCLKRGCFEGLHECEFMLCRFNVASTTDRGLATLKANNCFSAMRRLTSKAVNGPAASLRMVLAASLMVIWLNFLRSRVLSQKKRRGTINGQQQNGEKSYCFEKSIFRESKRRTKSLGVVLLAVCEQQSQLSSLNVVARLMQTNALN